MIKTNKNVPICRFIPTKILAKASHTESFEMYCPNPKMLRININISMKYLITSGTKNLLLGSFFSLIPNLLPRNLKKSCIAPMGQIYPQKILPNKVAVTTIEIVSAIDFVIPLSLYVTSVNEDFKALHPP